VPFWIDLDIVVAGALQATKSMRHLLYDHVGLEALEYIENIHQYDQLFYLIFAASR
jgi:hypothetical protein